MRSSRHQEPTARRVAQWASTTRIWSSTAPLSAQRAKSCGDADGVNDDDDEDNGDEVGEQHDDEDPEESSVSAAPRVDR